MIMRRFLLVFKECLMNQGRGWKGYKKAGTQKLFGKTYNRCVKANEELSSIADEDL